MKLQVSVEYFDFEQDFMEDDIRCIPMIVRFKLDLCGVKLKLKEWSKMTINEREQLATLPVDSASNLLGYTIYLKEMIYKQTGEEATLIAGENFDQVMWANNYLPGVLAMKLEASNMAISLEQWQNLSTLRRFALVKLARPGHENKNFPRAMREFGLA
jgi:hypothetical protein